MDPGFPSKQKFARLLDKYLKGQCTPQEEQLVIEWYDRVGKDQLENWNDNEFAEIEKRIHFNLSSQIRSLDNHSKEPSDSRNFSIRKSSAIAASIVLLIVSAALLYFFKDTGGDILKESGSAPMVVKNTKNTDQEVKLDDGSFIILKPGSSVAFSRPFESHSREVSLQGEAFFQVKRDENRPFLVFAGKIVTKVLGTSFSIKEEANKDVVVAVKTGKVSVSRKQTPTEDKDAIQEEVIITPNKQTTFNAEQNLFKTSLVTAPSIVELTQDLKVMEFDNAPLTEIFKALSKAYQVEIEYNEFQLSNCTLTTTLNKENLFDRLNIICKATGGSYSMEGTKIIIHDNGCKQP